MGSCMTSARVQLKNGADDLTRGTAGKMHTCWTSMTLRWHRKILYLYWRQIKQVVFGYTSQRVIHLKYHLAKKVIDSNQEYKKRCSCLVFNPGLNVHHDWHLRFRFTFKKKNLPVVVGCGHWDHHIMPGMIKILLWHDLVPKKEERTVLLVSLPAHSISLHIREQFVGSALILAHRSHHSCMAVKTIFFIIKRYKSLHTPQEIKNVWFFSHKL